MKIKQVKINSQTIIILINVFNPAGISRKLFKYICVSSYLETAISDINGEFYSFSEKIPSGDI